MCLAKPGEQVEAGQPVLELRADDPDKFERAQEALRGAITIGPERPETADPVLERISATVAGLELAS
jgi:thymidine phosphorylase